jgi:hypothetical protein
VQTDFATEGAQSGSRWAPLSPKYAAWKQQHYPGRGILLREGALKASLAGPDAPQAIFRMAPTSLEIGTSVRYALAHQNPRPGSRLPQRPPMRVTAAFMTVVGKDPAEVRAVASGHVVGLTLSAT